MVMKFLKSLFRQTDVDLGALLQQGAIVIDVRTKDEYAGGHIKVSLNIPLNELERNVMKLDKNKPLILCCASGMRSASGCRTLKAKGFTQVYNAGSWTNLRQYEK